ncbi:MAG: pyridoxal phosphate-dependent aminotransferase [Deltaproteobacteria bacterium]|nr:pyridoxal phosphate-dependent aminotransferase [Deltaproteobacteria bacterium]
MTIAKHIEGILTKSSWIRKMFEEGARLKAIHGAENVYDFSLGNPNLDPPEAFKTILKTLLDHETPGCHGYMPNTGYPEVRKAVADYLCSEQGVSISAAEIIMTCGAAGGLNVILKAIVDPGDEILTPTPHFVEYGFYVGNHGGILKTVPTHPDFTLNIEAISDAITPKTKAVLINSPNNPTGQIYSEDSLMALGKVLIQKGKSFGRTIYLMSDEPYRKVIYDGANVPSVFGCYAESIMTTSYSKDISIPGERIGFIAVNPAATYKETLLGAMALTNRILGFVNAPALMQRVIARMQGSSVDISAYARKRELLCGGLSESGYDFVKPPGTFYLFPRTPIPDDVEFVRALQKELILVVPGSGFGGPGHFRIAFCVSDDTIVKSLPGFKRVMDHFKP